MTRMFRAFLFIPATILLVIGYVSVQDYVEILQQSQKLDTLIIDSMK